MFGCMCLCAWLHDRVSAYMCVCESKRETVEGKWEFVTSKISDEQSRPLPSEAIHEPINWLCVCAQLCMHMHTHRSQWAFMSMFKLSI